MWKENVRDHVKSSTFPKKGKLLSKGGMGFGGHVTLFLVRTTISLFWTLRTHDRVFVYTVWACLCPSQTSNFLCGPLEFLPFAFNTIQFSILLSINMFKVFSSPMSRHVGKTWRAPTIDFWNISYLLLRCDTSKSPCWNKITLCNSS